MASVQDEMLTIAHIGDSRCYLFRKEKGCLFQTRDRIFLCSDGVYKSMSPQLLQETLIKEDSVEEITKTLDGICEKNGHDNYSVILMEVKDLYATHRVKLS